MPLLEKPIEPPCEPKQKPQAHFKDWPNEAGFTTTAEQHHPRALHVSGKFPAYAAGRLFRTGPSTYRVKTKSGGDYARSHWFDGFTWIHRFDLDAQDDGSVKVEYASRCQVDELLEEARVSGKLDGVSFGQKRDPCDSYFKKMKSAFHAAKNTAAGGPGYRNIGVAVGATPGKSTSDSLTVSTDANCIKEFDPATLEPHGITEQRHLHPDLKGPLSGAHPGVDPVTGDLFNYNVEFGPKIVYRVFKTNGTTGKTEILASISQKDIKAAYIHSLFITENYVVLCVWPAFFKGMGASILWEQSLLGAMAFDPSARTNWIVVDRKHGRGVVNRFTSDPIFAFHFVNGWEQTNDKGGTDIVCDLVDYPNMDVLHKFYYENLVSTAPASKDWTLESHPGLASSLKRYRLSSINTESSAASSKALQNPRPAETLQSVPSPYSGDLPRINESYMTKRHRYVYANTTRDLSSFVDCLVKTDMDSPDPKTSTLLWECPKHSPGEPIFIPNPDGATEDDGVVLSVVLNGETGTSYLLCLDAKTMQEVAKAEVEAAVGFGFHGIHLRK